MPLHHKEYKAPKLDRITAQSAMEYLVTYGWALLIIVAALAVIVVLGLTSSTAVPQTCTLSTAISCKDIVFGSNSIGSSAVMILSNSQQYPIKTPVLIINTQNNGNVTGTCSPSFVLPGGSIVCTATIPNAYGYGTVVSSSVYVKETVCTQGNSQQSCSGSQEIISGTTVSHVQPILSSTPFSISLSAQNLTQPANGQGDMLTAKVYLLGNPYQGAGINFTENQSSPVINPSKENSDSNGIALSYISSYTTGNVTVYSNFSGYSANVVIDFVSSTMVTFEAVNTMGINGSILTVNGNVYTVSQLPISIPILSTARDTYIFANSLTATNGLIISNPVVSGCEETSPYGVISVNYNCTIVATYTASPPAPYCTAVGSIGYDYVSASPGCSLYFCAGANWNYPMTSFSWNIDTLTALKYASSGSQTSNTCTAVNNSAVKYGSIGYQGLGVVGFNGIATGGYKVINSPTTFNSTGSRFSSSYRISSTSKVLLLVACGNYQCTSITFPSDCETLLMENLNADNFGTVAIALCYSQPPGTYTISGAAAAPYVEVAVEAALLSGSGSPIPTLTFSNGTSIFQGTTDNAVGTTAVTGDIVKILSCDGLSCTPNNVVATGTTTASYALNGLATGNYVFESEDANTLAYSKTYAVTVMPSIQSSTLYCNSAGNIGSNTLTAASGCSLYFCAGANDNYAMTSYSWSNDVVTSPKYASSGSQTSPTCTVNDSGGSEWQALGIVGFNGITAGSYNVINSPTTFNGVGSSFSSRYGLTSTSNVLLLVSCGEGRGSPCTSITFPSGCPMLVSENIGTAYNGTVAIALCSSQPPGTYTVSGTAEYYLADISVEAALLSGSGGALPTLTFSAGNSLPQGATDNAIGITSMTGHTVDIKYCSGTTCTPNNVVATGTTTVSYALNGLATGNYVMESCDTSIGICSLPSIVTVTTASCTFGETGYGSVSASPGCGLYFCAGANYNYAMTSYSWSNDVVTSSDFASSGSQTSPTCTANSGDLGSQVIGIIGFNGITAGSYNVINSPTTFNAIGGNSGTGTNFSSNYGLSSTSNILLLVACGNTQCTSITFPSGCVSKVSENVGNTNNATVAIAYCQSQPAGTYTVSGTSPSVNPNVYFSVEAALLSGSGGIPPTLTFSAGNSLPQGAADYNAIGITSMTGHTVDIKYCSGTTCTPNNVVATGTTTVSYALNGLATGNYVMESCDTSIGICSLPSIVTVTAASCTFGDIGYSFVSASPGCGLYFCAGANYNYAMTSYSWSNDIVTSPGYASSGNQTSPICTAASTKPKWQVLGIMGFNGITAGSYNVINSPTTFNGVRSFSSSYTLPSTSNVLLLVSCGYFTCTSITFPSDCQTQVSEGMGTSGTATVAIAYCKSQPANTYTISGISQASDSYVSVEAALLPSSASP